MSVSIQRAVPADIPFILQIEEVAAKAGYTGLDTGSVHERWMNDDDAEHLLITLDRAPAGYAVLLGFASKNRNILLRRIVLEEPGRGIGTKAIARLQQYVFEERSAHRFWLDVFDDNHRARRTYESAGFRPEGVTRDCIRSGKAYRSLVVMSILEDEYRERQAAVPSPGLFVSFEGLDGSGKSTQLRRLAARLRQEGREVVETAEPGGTAVGAQIRSLLLDPANQSITPESELLLYFAARSQNVEQSILPARCSGAIVLCDRFTDSTLAYQGTARGLPDEDILTLHRIACHNLWPDLTLFLDVDPTASLSRAADRGVRSGPPDRMEQQGAKFHQLVREGFLRLAARWPKRIQVVDGNGSADDVEAAIWPLVAARLN